jgi:hypothetical protein
MEIFYTPSAMEQRCVKVSQGRRQFLNSITNILAVENSIHTYDFSSVKLPT